MFLILFFTLGCYKQTFAPKDKVIGKPLVAIIKKSINNQLDTVDEEVDRVLYSIGSASSADEAKRLFSDLTLIKYQKMIMPKVGSLDDLNISFNSFIFYCLDFLIKNRIKYRKEIIEEFCFKKNFSWRVLNLNILHFAFIHNDIEISKCLLNSQFKDELLFFRDQNIMGRYSPIIMKSIVSSERDFIEFLEKLEEEITSEDLLKSGVLHLAANALKKDLFDYLVKSRNVNVNQDMSFEVYSCYEHFNRGRSEKSLIKERKSYSLLKALNLDFIKNFTSDWLLISEEGPNGEYVVNCVTSSFSGGDTKFGKSTASYKLMSTVSDVFGILLDKTLTWIEKRDEDRSEKLELFKSIFRTMVAKDYKIGDKREEFVISSGLIAYLGGDALGLVLEAGYKESFLGSGNIFVFDEAEGANYNQKIDRAQLALLPFITRSNISSDGNLDIFCKELKVRFINSQGKTFEPESISKEDRVLDLDYLRSKNSKINRENVVNTIVKFHDLFGLKKDKEIEYRGKKTTFMDYLVDNKFPQSVIENAIEHGFLAKNQLKEMKHRKQVKAIAEAIKRQKKREEAALIVKEEKEKRERELAKVRLETKGRKSEGVVSDHSYETINHENALKFFISSLMNNDYSLFTRTVNFVNVEDIEDVSIVEDSRMRKALIRRGLKVDKKLFLSILDLDQYDVMKVIVGERERDRDFVRMIMLDIKEDDINYEISEDMLIALGGFRGKFVEINRKFEEIEQEHEFAEEEKREVYISKNGMKELEEFSVKDSTREKLLKKIEDMRCGRFRGARSVESTDRVRELRILGRENIRVYYKLLDRGIYILKIYEKRDEVPIEELKLLEKMEEDQFQFLE